MMMKVTLEKKSEKVYAGKIKEKKITKSKKKP